MAAALALMSGMMGGCGNDSGAGEKPTTAAEISLTPEAAPEITPETTPEAAPETTPKVTPEITPEVTPETTPEPTSAAVSESEYTIPELETESFEVPDTADFQFVEAMQLGWNLGNTFDASDCTWLDDELDYESAWAGIKTSERLIQTVKEAGFQTIRIPVSWHNHVSGTDFTISDVWLNRVQEIVDIALAQGMYVILNTHHDVGADYYYPTSEYLESSIHYVESIWTQLAEHFADYDERLIFESLNEPRMVGTNNEWWLNTSDPVCQDSVACINAMNQAFVDTIRAAEGQNESRYLMVPGYAASADGALYTGFELPADTVEDKLIVSVHAYTPYDFALNENGTNAFSVKRSSDLAGITGFMDQLYDKFIANGIPVVIGEFGARAKHNTQERVDFAAAYIQAARARGITCCWWDNNAFIGNGELFGLIDRASMALRFEEIITAMVKYSVR